MLLKQLESFKSVIEKGSISAAAAHIGISQPAVSKHIAGLEADLGVSLFKRGHKCSQLTPEGEIVYEHARRILRSSSDIYREIADTSNQLSGVIKISASSIPGDFVLPDLLIGFSEEYPGLHIEVNISDSKTALERLVSHDVDFAIIGEEKHPPGFKVSSFFDDEIVLVVKPDHPLASKKTINPEETCKLSFVGRTEGSGTRKVIEKYFHEHKLGLGQYRLSFGHVAAVLNAVERGAEAGLVSKRALPKISTLKPIPLNPPIKRHFYLIHGTILSNAMGTVLDYLIQKSQKELDKI